jgi:hypothetical protein
MIYHRKRILKLPLRRHITIKNLQKKMFLTLIRLRRKKRAKEKVVKTKPMTFSRGHLRPPNHLV